MTVTEQLIHLAGGSLQQRHEVDDENSAYSMFNTGGVECEVGEFLFGMIRVCKPSLVLETGSHFGVGASYMGMALRENRIGVLHTWEYLPANHVLAKGLIKDLALDQYVECHLGYVPDDVPTVEQYDMIFLDTEPKLRFEELIHFYPYLRSGGFVFIHDLHGHMSQIDNEEHGFGSPYGILPNEIISMVQRDRLRPFHFPNPRGMTGFYKPAPQDFKWQEKF